ncbi:MAG: hypothetical protein M3131_03460 [Actinomycetota bacterium]|nr:hypothetical protein [Actinomycetota bacterium]
MSAGARLALSVTVGGLLFGGGFAAGQALDPDPRASRGTAHPVPQHQGSDHSEGDR